MRDESRIEPLMMEIAQLWREHCSDWRLGQLFNNLQQYCDNDLFFYEDDKILLKLKEMIKEYNL